MKKSITNGKDSEDSEDEIVAVPRRKRIRVVSENSSDDENTGNETGMFEFNDEFVLIVLSLI